MRSTVPPTAISPSVRQVPQTLATIQTARRFNGEALQVNQITVYRRSRCPVGRFGNGQNTCRVAFGVRTIQDVFVAVVNDAIFITEHLFGLLASQDIPASLSQTSRGAPSVRKYQVRARPGYDQGRRYWHGHWRSRSYEPYFLNPLS